MAFCLLQPWLFGKDSPFLHTSFVDLTCVLYMSNLSKWIRRCLKLLMASVTSPLKEIAGIACPTALMLRVHYRAVLCLELLINESYE